MFDPVSFQIVAPQNTNNLCYENVMFSSPKYRAESNVNATKQSMQAKQESPADAVKPARRKSMPKLLQFDVFRFISPNSISQNCQCIASRLGSRPI